MYQINIPDYFALESLLIVKLEEVIFLEWQE
jgi:hypothetical protein